MFFTRQNGLVRFGVAGSLSRRGISKTKELPYTEQQQREVMFLCFNRVSPAVFLRAVRHSSRKRDDRHHMK